MNKSWIVLLVVALFACDNQEQESDQTQSSQDMPANQGRNVVVADMKIDTANPPVLFFKDPLFDFGTIKEGEKVSHTYTFKNKGKSALIIADAQSPCGCTVPKFPVEPIMPGESGKIDVVFNSSGKSGTIHKKIRIIANTYPEKTQIVVLKGVVE